MNLSTPPDLRREIFIASLPWKCDAGIWEAVLLENPLYSLRFRDWEIFLLRGALVLSKIKVACEWNPVRALLLIAHDSDELVWGDLTPALLKVAPEQVPGRSWSFSGGKISGLHSTDRHPLVPSWCQDDLREFLDDTGLYVASLDQDGRELHVPVAPGLRVVITLDREIECGYRKILVPGLGDQPRVGGRDPDGFYWGTHQSPSLMHVFRTIKKVRASCMEDGFVREADWGNFMRGLWS